MRWLYVPSKVAGDLRYVYHKQTPTTTTSKPYETFNGLVLTRRRGKYNGDDYGWPGSGDILPNGWYVDPNDGQLPMKIRPADEEGVLDPTGTLYYQAFYYLEGGEVTRTVRGYFKRYTNTSSKNDQFGDGKGGDSAVSFEEI